MLAPEKMELEKCLWLHYIKCVVGGLIKVMVKVVTGSGREDNGKREYT